MRIYDFTETGNLILLTHTGSHKWKEFSNHPYISISIISEDKLIQLIVNGRIRLNTPSTAPKEASHYWAMVRSDVKKIYDSSHEIGELYRDPSSLKVPHKIPETFGIAHVIPSFWEVLQLNSEYVESHRFQFQLKKGAWHKQRVAVG